VTPVALGIVILVLILIRFVVLVFGKDRSSMTQNPSRGLVSSSILDLVI